MSADDGAPIARSTKRYELVDHTADRAVLIHGANASEIYQNATWALCDVLCHAAAINLRITRPVEAVGADLGETTVRLLNSLIYHCDVEGLVLPDLVISEASETKVRGQAWGEPLDPEVHGFKGAIKAATYHDLRLEHTSGMLRLRIVLDV